MEGEVIAARTMNSLYIWLDIAYLMMLLGVLLWTKRRQAVIAGLIGGALYFAVDYCVFYLLLGTRQVVGADPFWFLLWLSISYGFTNFVWIWLWLDRDGHTLEWSILIVAGWLATALLSQNFGNQFSQISIMRGTNDYHGIMALILVIGYGIVCIYNIRLKDKKDSCLMDSGHWHFGPIRLGICFKYNRNTQSEFANFNCQFSA